MTGPAVRHELTGWGRGPSVASLVRCPTTTAAVGEALAAAPGTVTVRGCGSSYGDAALGRGGTTLDLRGLRRVLSLDHGTGIVVAEAGATLAAVGAAAVSTGWRFPVQPGTARVTLGGAVAADVHGKNHVGAGSFAAQVSWLELMSADGTIGRISPSAVPTEYWATVGGMGLTGVILRVAVRLHPVGSGVAVRHRRRARDLDQVMGLVDEAAARQRGDPDLHVVAWIDGTGWPGGRGIVETVRLVADDGSGSWVTAARRHGSPDLVSLPGRGVIGRPAVRLANSARWHATARSAWGAAPAPRALQPLDRAYAWPALFGRRGLVQYQCVVPDGAEDAVGRILRTVWAVDQWSALTTLKRLGAADDAPLSFPLPGWTLAMDFPARSPRLEPLLRRLDTIVAEAGGRVYLAKDARLPSDTLGAMYPRAAQWRRVRDRMDPSGVFGSDLGRRLGLVPDGAPR